MKKIITYIAKGAAFSVFLCFLALSSINSGNTAFAATTYYNSVQKETITKGLTYEKSSRVTDAGLLDVYVLRLDMGNPYLSVSTIKSKTDYSLKETTSKLVNDNGAIAGINGDFFGLNDKYSIPMGVEVANGQILSINENSNNAGNGNATFFIDKDNNPFMEYVRTEVHFLNEGKETLKVSNVNKIFDLQPPSIITTAAMETTAQIDARLPGIYKLVCYDGKIQYISAKGETVDVPPDGYVVAMNEVTANRVLSSFAVGQRVEFFLRPSIDYSKINNAITGAGKILTQGILANDGGTVAGGRQPRTAIGITKDKKQIILMVVDGRSHSIGATQAEMAALMQEYGAFEAMHLDGGGSSAMAVAKLGEKSANVVNTVSEGSQRKVINALGIFNNSPVGEVKTVVVKPASKNALKGSFLKIEVYGLDEYNNKIDLPPEALTYSGTSGSGSFLDGYFMPSVTGWIQLNASFNEMTGSANIYSDDIAVLTPGKGSIKLYAGATAVLNFSGKTKNGMSVSVDRDIVAYEVVPADLGYVSDGIFTASRTGSGWIKCGIGDVVTYISVYATITSKLIANFETAPPIKAAGYPESVYTLTSYTDERVLSGIHAIKFTYMFSPSTETQAAYAVFEPGLTISNQTDAFRLSVFGDNSNHWLRAKIFDATNKEYIIDFAKNINWTGWKEVEASVPAEVKFPITLDRIYAASLSETEENVYTIYFDDLKGMYESSSVTVETPESTKFTDYLSYTMDKQPAEGYDITFMPSIYYSGKKDPAVYSSERKKAITALLTNSAKGVYMASEDLEKEAVKPIKFNDGKYSAELVDNVLLISLNSQKGGFMQSDPSQWSNIKTSIMDSPASSVIIYTDLSPFSFKQKKEYELFHAMLVELRQSRKTIFVISDEWVVNKADVVDGIRYINVGRMYNSDGTINNVFSILRFKINGNDIRYCFDKLMK